MEFPILYARTSTGAIQQWQIKVEGDSFLTESGQVGGVITQSKPTIVKGKNPGKANATTPEEQALKEAQAKHDKQLKTGYFLNPDDVDNMAYIEPMLAKGLKDAKKVDYSNGLVQCKYNGGRCTASVPGLFSRKGEAFLAVPHIFEELTEKGFFEEHPDAFLDGELFNEELRQHLNEIMSLIRRTKNITPEHLERSRQLIKLYVYDGYGFNGTTKDTPYEIRKAMLDEIVAKYDFLEHVPTIPVTSEEEVWAAYQKFVDDGHEGGILRFRHSPYEHKRSSHLYKLKPTDDAEFEVLDVSEGSGNWAGLAKIIHCRMDDGRPFNASFKGNMEQAKLFLETKEQYIGKRYTLFYNGFTGLGIPNSAQFDFVNSVKEEDK